MKTTQLPYRIQPQPEGSLHHETDPILPHDGVQTMRYLLGI